MALIILTTYMLMMRGREPSNLSWDTTTIDYFLQVTETWVTEDKTVHSYPSSLIAGGKAVLFWYFILQFW